MSIDCPVRKNPLKHAKSLTVTRKIEIYHFFDYESDEPIHIKGFQEVLDNMKKAEKIGKESTISEIVKLVIEATNTKAPIAKIADTVSGYFVPTVIIIAFITFFSISK